MHACHKEIPNQKTWFDSRAPNKMITLLFLYLHLQKVIQNNIILATNYSSYNVLLFWSHERFGRSEMQDDDYGTLKAKMNEKTSNIMGACWLFQSRLHCPPQLQCWCHSFAYSTALLAALWQTNYLFLGRLSRSAYLGKHVVLIL
jgi:hypothetical protein